MVWSWIHSRIRISLEVVVILICGMEACDGYENGVDVVSWIAREMRGEVLEVS